MAYQLCLLLTLISAVHINTHPCIDNHSYARKAPLILTNRILDEIPDDELHVLAMKQLQDQMNKKLVLNFYQEVLIDYKTDAAYKYLDENTYIQHGPYVADGRQAIIEILRKVTYLTTEIHHIGSDGDMVYVHARTGGIPDGTNNTVVDMYRVRNQKIVEHWDVTQNYKMFANDHPYF